MIDTKKLIDSNILVYAFDKNEITKNKKAKSIILTLIEDNGLVLSVQNLSEFFVTVTQKIEMPISIENAKEIIIKFMTLPNINILKILPKSVIEAIEISEKFKINYWDALIAAVMQENNINTIITENEKDFKKISWIKVINPFK